MEMIKRKLANKRCRVSMEVLKRGLVTPMILTATRRALLPNAM